MEYILCVLKLISSKFLAQLLWASIFQKFWDLVAENL